MALTKKQEKFYELLKDFFKEKRVSPKLFELKKWLKEHDWEIASLNSLTQYLKILEQEGKIERNSKMRGIKLLGRYDTISVPFIPSIASCGDPTNFLNEDIENYFEVSRTLVKKPDRTFIFEVQGDSMNKAGIEEGNFLLVEQTENLKDGDIVLATVDGCCTVKRLRRGPDTITLLSESANPANKPIYLHDTDDFVIAGKVLYILKN